MSGKEVKVVAFAMQKGGTGKSTTCGGFAEALLRRGRTVLVMDLDPQGNLGFTMGADVSMPCADTLLAPDADVSEPSRWIQHPAYCDLVAAGARDDADGALDTRSKEISTDTAAGAWRLEDALVRFKPLYDYILVDTPPNMDAMTMNALAAADEVVIPVDPDVQTARRLGDFVGYIRRIQRRMNTRLAIAGIVVTQYREGVNSCKDFYDGVKASCEAAGIRLFSSPMHLSDDVKKAHEQGVGVYEVAARRSRFSGRYRVDDDLDAIVGEYLGEEA